MGIFWYLLVSFGIFCIFFYTFLSFFIRSPFDIKASEDSTVDLLVEMDLAETMVDGSQTTPTPEGKQEDCGQPTAEAGSEIGLVETDPKEAAATAEAGSEIASVETDPKEAAATAEGGTELALLETGSKDNEDIQVPVVQCGKCGSEAPINQAQARSATTYWCNSCNSVMKTLRTNLSWPPFCFEGLPEIAKKEFFMSAKSLKEREKELKYSRIRDVLLKSVSTSRTEELIKQKGGTFWPLSVYAKNLIYA